jgi:succinate dehydrogenase/fumarate reductase flavoprotein subunit
MQELDRRTFLKGGAVAAGSATLLALAGCSPKAAGEGDSGGGSTTGADNSNTSSAAEAWYGSPQDPSTFEGAEEIDTELLIIGYGAGGIVAAAFAAQQGLKVTVIEKGGSSSNIKSEFAIINAGIDASYGVTVDPQTIVNEHTRYASGFCDPRVTRVWVEESGATFDWLAEVGAEFGATPFWETDVGNGWHGVWPVYPVSHGFHYVYTPEELDAAAAAIAQTGDPASAQGILPDISVYLKRKSEEWGVTVDYQTSLIQLAQDESGKVTGAYAESDGAYRKYSASAGVILATGGYESNPELLELLNPESASICGYNMAWPTCTGDGIKAGIWAGGVKDDVPTLMTFGRAAIAPDAQLGYPYQGMTCWMGDQPFLKVNLNGERVCCETSPYDYPLHVAAQQPECKLATVWDANYKDNIVAYHTIGCSRINPSSTVDPEGVPTGTGMGVEPSDMMIAGALEAGIIQQADTIAELATKMRMPPEALEATIARYNELCEKGVDEDFGKPAHDLHPLTTPPFTASYFGGHVLCTLDGLKINEDMQVLNAEKQPIEGLYAVGNCSGSMFAASYPELFIGNANGRTTTFARHAVQHILGK